MQNFYTINRRPVLVLVALMVCGCSGPKTPEKSAPAPSESVVNSKSAGSGVKADSPSDGADPRTEAQQRTDEHRTWFRTVLSGGYRVRPKTASDKFVEYCRSSYRKLLKNPDTTRPFLEDKLRNGRIQERPLAIHLLGSMGEAAASSARHIVGVLTRSWEVALNRCVAKKTGSKVGGRPVEATDEIRAACVMDVQGSRPPTSVSMACSALERIGEPRTVGQILKTGIGGHFARPCATHLVSHNLDSAAVLRFIAAEIDGKPNGDLLWSTLVRRGAPGVGAMVQILEARARSAKVYDEPVCLAARFVQAYRAQGGTAADLTADTQSRLAQLSSGRLADDHVVPDSIARCALQIQKVLKAPSVRSSRPLVAPRTRAEFGPFCPNVAQAPSGTR